MIEVLRTNVTCRQQADMLISRIQEAFAGYRATFDLEDCDRILRVQNTVGSVSSSSIILLLYTYGYSAAVLPDEIVAPAYQKMAI